MQGDLFARAGNGLLFYIPCPEFIFNFCLPLRYECTNIFLKTQLAPWSIKIHLLFQ